MFLCRYLGFWDWRNGEKNSLTNTRTYSCTNAAVAFSDARLDCSNFWKGLCFECESDRTAVATAGVDLGSLNLSGRFCASELVGNVSWLKRDPIVSRYMCQNLWIE